MRSKYFNKKTVYMDDVRGELKFDSVKEKNHYLVLKEKEKQGLIKDLELQKSFLLTPATSKVEVMGKDGTKIVQATERGCSYKADFFYYDFNTGYYTVVDVKGFRTKDYIIKRKMFKFLYRQYLFLEV